MGISPKFLDELDEQQRTAVLTTNGPVIVFAGAGSGKTRVLTYRVAYLTYAVGVPPSFIMAVTFTNKAAEEMKERLQKLIGSACEQMWIGTFHAICARMLRMHGARIGLKNNFVIFDEDDQTTLIKRIMRELKLEGLNPIAVREAISNSKVNIVKPIELAERAQNPFENAVATIYERYEATLRLSNAVDFDDLLLYALRMLQEDEGVLGYYSKRFQYIHVDEYQDVNRLQHELVCTLSSLHRNVFIVGDDDQAIYGWRMASARFMLELKERFKDAKIITLEKNYRSTGTILEAAHHVIQNNRIRHEKRLQATREKGCKIFVYEALDENKEALFVANMIRELISQCGKRYGDFAVMYRVNAQSRPFEETFAFMGIPYRVVGAMRFYERREIKDILAFMRLLVNMDDEVSLLRVINLPPRGIGDATIRALRTEANSLGLPLSRLVLEDVKIKSLSRRQLDAVLDFRGMLRQWRWRLDKLSIPQLIQTIIEESGYAQMLLHTEDEAQARERLANIEQLAIAAQRAFGDEPASKTLQPFLEQIALMTPQDEVSWEGEAVTLLTVHSAKGLEFPVVFVVGLEEGLFPHSRSMSNEEEFEEERRLFYVALTRAKDMVFLTSVAKRMRKGSDGYTYHFQKASRFIDEIPEGLKCYLYGDPTVRGFIPVFSPTVALHHLQSAGLNFGMHLGALKPALSRIGSSNESFSDDLSSSLADELTVGDRVFHVKFGTGVVKAIECVGSKRHVYVLFDDPAVGEKCLAPEYAPLKKLT
jgi:DNA helicase-2/ATP-dependent DNA helicase PcrA